VALATGDVIGEEHLMLGNGVPATTTVAPVAGNAKQRTLRAAMSRHILQVLEDVGGNKRRAARELGVSRATLDRKLREISKPASR
jgi:DNA-binding NtrC family response regulator